MFDFLKKKIGGFIDGLTKKEEAKEPVTDEKPAMDAVVPEEIEKEEALPAKPREKGTPPKEKRAQAPPPQKKEAPKKAGPGPQKMPKERVGPARGTEAVPEKTPTGGFEPQKRPDEPEQPEPVRTEPQAPGLGGKEKPAAKPADDEPAFLKEISRPVPEPPEPEMRPEAQVQEARPEPPPAMQKKPQGPAEEKPKERIKLGIVGTVKSIITREVEISEKDVGEMLDSLELELLEADVDLAVAEGIKSELSSKLLGAKVKKDELHSYVSGAISGTLVDVLTNEKSFDIAERADSAEKPLKVAFLGINGAGKTTTIAKVAKLLMDRKKKVVFAAADTFRAAAIEQMSVHGDRLGVKVIKRDYGSDPTSVAYDAVNYARAHGIDAVLIDTAGRQDTNISLINEMKKLDRVIKPDIKIYVGESIAGNAIIEQVSAFNREIGIDAVILTKLDCDPKGGTMLSISKATGIPIIYVGVGQGYDELEKFDPEAIVRRIVG